MRFFGTDLEPAMVRWANEKDHLLAGLDPPRLDANPTIAELANLYLDASRKRVSAETVREDHTAGMTRTLERAISAVGKNARPELMNPDDWQKVREALSVGTHRKAGKPLAHRTVKLELARLRAFLNWCVKHRKLKAFDAGDALKAPEQVLLRRQAAARGKRLWEPNEFLAVLKASSVLFRPVLLLSLNAAMGVSDIARLKRSQINAKTEYLTYARHKTGVERCVWLWPETRAAILEAVAKRPEPARQKFGDRLLLTRSGLPWQRVEGDVAVDLSYKPFTSARSKAGVKDRNLYDCRRTFRTKISVIDDPEAVAYCMGHQLPGEGGTYVQEIEDARVRRVCEHVRTWLYG